VCEVLVCGRRVAQLVQMGPRYWSAKFEGWEGSMTALAFVLPASSVYLGPWQGSGLTTTLTRCGLVQCRSISARFPPPHQFFRSMKLVMAKGSAAKTLCRDNGIVKFTSILNKLTHTAVSPWKLTSYDSGHCEGSASCCRLDNSFSPLKQ
jgi:hypothetical protein